jgi:hypothetical protein
MRCPFRFVFVLQLNNARFALVSLLFITTLSKMYCSPTEILYQICPNYLTLICQTHILGCIIINKYHNYYKKYDFIRQNSGRRCLLNGSGG